MELPSLLEETGSELTLLEQGMRRLHNSIAATTRNTLKRLSCARYSQQLWRTFTPSPILNMRRSPPYSISKTLGTITKETLKNTTMAFESIEFMQPLPSAEISAETETAVKLSFGREVSSSKIKNSQG